MKFIVVNLKTIFKTQFFKFVLVGGFCTLQNIFWLYCLTSILKIHYLISMIVLTIIVNSLGYYLNNKYTFQKNNHNFWQGLLKYHFIMLGSFLTVLLLMYILVDILNVWYLLANIIITIGMTIYNFFLHKKLTFK